MMSRKAIVNIFSSYNNILDDCHRPDRCGNHHHLQRW